MSRDIYMHSLKKKMGKRKEKTNHYSITSIYVRFFHKIIAVYWMLKDTKQSRFINRNNGYPLSWTCWSGSNPCTCSSHFIWEKALGSVDSNTTATPSSLHLRQVGSVYYQHRCDSGRGDFAALGPWLIFTRMGSRPPHKTKKTCVTSYLTSGK